MKRQNGGMASERRTTERQTTTPWLFCELFCWVIRNTEEFQKRQLLGRFVSLFVGSFGTLNNSRNATYLPHLLSTAETVPIWTIYSTHRTPDAWRWQSTYVWNSMAGWPQNDRTTERTTTERQTQRLQNGGNRYLPTTFIIDSGIGTYLNDLWYTPDDDNLLSFIHMINSFLI